MVRVRLAFNETIDEGALVANQPVLADHGHKLKLNSKATKTPNFSVAEVQSGVY
jgi:hypothetical protein